MLSFEEVAMLKDGFFAKRIISAIKMGGEVDESKRTLFKRVINYLDTIEDGKQQIHTGNLVEHPVRSISAYRKAIEIVAILPSENEAEEKFNSILTNVRNEVQSIVEGKNNVSIETLKTTYQYFKEARKLAIQETTRDSISGQELVTWQTPMQF
ncbi:hypothetical protein [Nitrososphaera sp.]|uniref:hypothetical protein n=1 Tax=Nitrososphaera sp. TaxID=1971748 RepID=UPI00307E8DCF